ncbi:hypothetical protein [Tepidanaerobacter syntrophicus]|uniref:hypothetical protein n=1 Tax=Tepidanaerobacter syntrophicus TaxID=224999 RepID=UPI001BD4A1A0|nr:hypothetical protein [Tepidanaerobacter syntrophicus]
MLFLLTKRVIGINAWVDELDRVPLYAILSGFVLGDVTCVGTFYYFFDRLWAASGDNFKPRKQKRKRKRKPKKGKKGEKAPSTIPSRIKSLVKWMVRHLDKQMDLPMNHLFLFFQSQFLAASARFGLLRDMGLLGVAGDGTPVTTSVCPRNKSTCDCYAQGLVKYNHPRIY